MPETTLYGPGQSRFARLLERREERRPDEGSRALRGKLLTGIRGRVVEVGCGNGPAFEHYAPGVERVLAVEPDPVARVAAAESAAAAAAPIDVVEGFAERLPADAGGFDAVVCIWVLCSVPDVSAALREFRRVLVPGGELRVYEHVRSSRAPFRAVQHAVDSLFWTRSLGGCETTRDTEAAIRAAGFEFDWIERGFQPSTLLTITAAPYILGTARKIGV
jgi:ubiquinone/menaquinone biosynthesis C-methylase UbiE